MSLTNLNTVNYTLSLDGLNTIEADSIILDGKEIDFSKYYTSSETDSIFYNKTQISTLYNTITQNTALYYDKTQVNNLLSGYLLTSTFNIEKDNLLNAINLKLDTTTFNTEIAKYSTSTQVSQLITSSLIPYSTTTQTTNLILNNISSNNTLYYSKTDIDNKNYQNALQVQGMINTSLSSFSTTTQTTTLINNSISSNNTLYYTKTDIDNKDFRNSTQVNTAINNAISSYSISASTELSGLLMNYVTNTFFNQTITGYTPLTKLDEYYNKTQITTLYNNKTETTTILNNYYTKTQVDDTTKPIRGIPTADIQGWRIRWNQAEGGLGQMEFDNWKGLGPSGWTFNTYNTSGTRTSIIRLSHTGQNENIAVQSWVDAKNYVNSTTLTSNLSSYTPLTKLNEYYNITGITTLLNSYLTTSSFNNTIANYSTTNQINGILTSYATISMLENYTPSGTTQSNLYYTKTQSTSLFYQPGNDLTVGGNTITFVNSEHTIRNYNKYNTGHILEYKSTRHDFINTANNWANIYCNDVFLNNDSLITKLSNIYTKTQSDANYLPKSTNIIPYSSPGNQNYQFKVVNKGFEYNSQTYEIQVNDAGNTTTTIKMGAGQINTNGPFNGVSTTKFSYLSSISSDLQTQLNNRYTKTEVSTLLNDYQKESENYIVLNGKELKCANANNSAGRFWVHSNGNVGIGCDDNPVDGFPAYPFDCRGLANFNDINTVVHYYWPSSGSQKWATYSWADGFYISRRNANWTYSSAPFIINNANQFQLNEAPARERLNVKGGLCLETTNQYDETNRIRWVHNYNSGWGELHLFTSLTDGGMQANFRGISSGGNQTGFSNILTLNDNFAGSKKVGINTNNPTYNLDVNGGVRIRGISSANTDARSLQIENYGHIQIKHPTVAGRNRLFIAENGNVGLGIDNENPSSRLTIKTPYNASTDGIMFDANDGTFGYFMRIYPYVIGANQVGYAFETDSKTGGNNIPLRILHNGGISVQNNMTAGTISSNDWIYSSGDCGSAKMLITDGSQSAYGGVLFRGDISAARWHIAIPGNYRLAFYRAEGGDKTMQAYIDYDGTYVKLSDERLKENIEDLNENKSLEKILKLKVKHYKMKNSPFDNTKKCIGFISQEVEEVIPEAISTFTDLEKDEAKLKHLNYNDIFIHNVNATKVLYSIIQQQEEVINSLKTDIETLKNIIKQQNDTLIDVVNYIQRG